MSNSKKKLTMALQLGKNDIYALFFPKEKRIHVKLAWYLQIIYAVSKFIHCHLQIIF
jgi:hypothetical protein